MLLLSRKLRRSTMKATLESLLVSLVSLSLFNRNLSLRFLEIYRNPLSTSSVNFLFTMSETISYDSNAHTVIAKLIVAKTLSVIPSCYIQIKQNGLSTLLAGSRQTTTNPQHLLQSAPKSTKTLSIPHHQRIPPPPTGAPSPSSAPSSPPSPHPPKSHKQPLTLLTSPSSSTLIKKCRQSPPPPPPSIRISQNANTPIPQPTPLPHPQRTQPGKSQPWCLAFCGGSSCLGFC